VFDGNAPPDLDLFGGAVVSSERAVDRIVEECNADPAYLAVSPDLAQDLLDRRQILRDTPRPILANGTATVETEA